MDLRSRAVALTLAGVTAGVLALSAGPRLAHAGEILPGVTVAGVDVGGLSESEAITRLDEESSALAQSPVTLTFEDQSFDVTADEFGWSFDAASAASAAMEIGRDQNPLANTIRHLRATFGGAQDVEATAQHDEAGLSRVVTGIAARVDQDPGTGGLEADPDTLTVTAVGPPRGLTVDVDATRAIVLAAARTPGPDQATLPVDQIDAPVTMEQVENAARRAEAAIGNPIRLFHDGVEVILEPADLARLITLRVKDGDVFLDADAAEIERRFADVVEDLERVAINAQIDVARTPAATLDAKADTTWRPIPVNLGIIPSTPGATFDADLAAAQVGDLLESGQTEAKIALREVEADHTTADIEAMGITHLLGTFTSYHSCCAARVHNIQTLAELVDGTLVESGEQFSINQISGNRTCQKGFQAAGMILNGEIVDSCGGGVSQFGTTTFNAAFFAGVQLDAWKAHSFYISRYPMGREATLNFPSPDIDVKFTNDTGHGMFIRTGYTGTSITVSIYGQSEVTKVEATRSGTFNPRGWTTQRRVNSALAPGQEVRVQSGAGGFTVRVNRFVHRGDDISEDEIVTVYVPIREIIEYGPGQPAPAPSPSPSPSGSPSPAPSPKPSASPSGSPTPKPSSSPTPQPSPSPSPKPSSSPTPQPAPTPTPPPPASDGEGGDANGA